MGWNDLISRKADKDVNCFGKFMTFAMLVLCTIVLPIFGVVISCIFGLQKEVKDGPLYLWFLTYGLTQVSVLAGFTQQAFAAKSFEKTQDEADAKKQEKRKGVYDESVR